MQWTKPPVESPATERRVENLHLRNYDFEHAYELRVEVRDGDESVLARRFYARPGWSRSLDDHVPPGKYDVVVTLDGDETERARCRIDDDADHSVLIECGNGCVSIAQGLY